MFWLTIIRITVLQDLKLWFTTLTQKTSNWILDIEGNNWLNGKRESLIIR